MKIAIYGVGLEGEKFYCRYKKVYEITFAIDKNCNRTFHGIPVYSIEQLESFLKNNNTGGGYSVYRYYYRNTLFRNKKRIRKHWIRRE